MPTLVKFSKNEQGNDYVVGDIHGMFDLLEAKLNALNFDKTKDRLFSVGDLVDRGPDSRICLSYLDQPWFHAVRGNHEQMAIEFGRDGMWPVSSYLANGGEWFFKLNEEERQQYINVFDEMPLAFEIETDNGTVGIIHAEVPYDDWSNLYNNLIVYDNRQTILWSRTKIRGNNVNAVANIDKVYVGHTVLKEHIVLGNVHYIDTGAVFTGKLTIVKL